MVKFSKELEAKLIPEWKDKYVDYCQLKKHVKKVKEARKQKQVTDTIFWDFGRSVFDPVRALARKIAASWTGEHDPENNQVKSKTSVGEDGEEEKEEEEEEEEEEESHETELVQLFSEEHEVKMFFEMLDEELDKVNQFYKTKETEVLERGEAVNKQLQFLLDHKSVHSERHRKNQAAGGGSGFLSRSASDFSESQSHSDTHSQTDDVKAALDKNGTNFVNPSKAKPKTSTRIDIPAPNPTRTIAAVKSMLWEEDLVKNPKKGANGGEFINRKQIQSAEKKIRRAFVELYKALDMLQKFSSLNMVAFKKILKKFDKVANQQASASYLKKVKLSHFVSSDKVVRLMDEVESLFTQHFANSDRKMAMKFLRPQQHKDSHMVTFFVGLFTGSFVTLFSVYVILAHLSGLLSHKTEAGYVETVFPFFSMFALLSLHLFMYGCNLFMWKSTRINYHFIFEFQPNNALNYRDAFLICTTLMTSVVVALVIHLLLLYNGANHRHVDYIPGVLFLSFVALLINPFNIFYRPTRFCFLRVMRNIVCSPFCKVVLVDFFMADQLTSQIPLLRHMESAACYFVAGSFKTHHFETCKSGKHYREFAYIISFAPYYWRAMQCARRWFDEGNVDHLANLGKYVSAMLAAGARLTFASQPTPLWMAIVLVTSLVATAYQLYWDFVKDWGLFNPKSKNPWLRDELALKNRGIYYCSIAFNFVLRVAWVETVMKFNTGMLETRLIDFLLASLEVIRRGHWNFFRLENEHLNNVGKYRAVKTVPLPFRETDSDG